MGGCQQVCVNTPGGFHCTCRPGYTLDSNGITCTSMIQLQTNIIAKLHGCHFIILSFGFSCMHYIQTDINECATSNGGCEVYCTDTDGSFTCSCDNHEILDATGLFCVGA